ncbi:MAG: helix-turn-helix transcriptional regulator [[Eubacterium] siraeum]
MQFAPIWRDCEKTKHRQRENISTDILMCICEALDCTIEDILETIKD